jgi:hypothetical protein
MNMAADDVIHLEALYPYAYQGRDMFAITSPFRMEPDKLELVGGRVRIGPAEYIVKSIGRVTQGPTHQGEIVGIVVEPA